MLAGVPSLGFYKYPLSIICSIRKLKFRLKTVFCLGPKLSEISCNFCSLASLLWRRMKVFITIFEEIQRRSEKEQHGGKTRNTANCYIQLHSSTFSLALLGKPVTFKHIFGILLNTKTFRYQFDRRKQSEEFTVPLTAAAWASFWTFASVTWLKQKSLRKKCVLNQMMWIRPMGLPDPNPSLFVNKSGSFNHEVVSKENFEAESGSWYVSQWYGSADQDPYKNVSHGSASLS